MLYSNWGHMTDYKLQRITVGLLTGKNSYNSLLDTENPTNEYARLFSITAVPISLFIEKLPISGKHSGLGLYNSKKLLDRAHIQGLKIYAMLITLVSTAKLELLGCRIRKYASAKVLFNWPDITL
jgi:hypothetical protein